MHGRLKDFSCFRGIPHHEKAESIKLRETLFWDALFFLQLGSNLTRLGNMARMAQQKKVRTSPSLSTITGSGQLKENIRIDRPNEFARDESQPPQHWNDC